MTTSVGPQSFAQIDVLSFSLGVLFAAVVFLWSAICQRCALNADRKTRNAETFIEPGDLMDRLERAADIPVGNQGSTESRPTQATNCRQNVGSTSRRGR